jgi:hypothetical protein
MLTYSYVYCWLYKIVEVKVTVIDYTERLHTNKIHIQKVQLKQT